MSTLRLAVILAAAATVVACSFEDPCEFGRCETADAGRDAAGGDDSGSNGTANSGGTPDSGNTGNSNAGDAGGNSATDSGTGSEVDAGVPDASDPNNSASPVCEVDVFDFQCAADEYEVNDQFPHNLATVGCAGTLEPKTLDMIVDARVCPLERFDRFDVNMVPCDNDDVLLEVTLELENTCSDALWDFEVPGCEDSDLTCTFAPDGMSFTAVQRAGAIGFNSPNFGVRTRADIFVDYRIRVVSRAL